LTASSRAPEPAALSARRTELPRAAASMAAAAFLFALMSVAVKLSSRTLPNAMVVFLRSAVGLLALAPFIARAPLRSLKTRHLAEHVLRGAVGMAAMYCFFFTISRLGLAEALLVNYSLPLYIPIVSRVWLGEPIARGVWKALAIGLFGLALILKPGSSIFQPAALVGVLGAILGATAQVGVRGLTRTESITSIVFYFGLVSTGISLGPALYDWVTPHGSTLWVLLGLGVSATAAQLLMTRAYHYAPAAAVGPFIYLSVVFAALFDWLIFTRSPDALTLCGAICVVLAGAVALRL
jgi:drug/metabolite transporter (DMT)-like permease